MRRNEGIEADDVVGLKTLGSAESELLIHRKAMLIK
jgi:hypothetical protein